MAYISSSDLKGRLSTKEQIRLYADKTLPTDPEPVALDTNILTPLINQASLLMDGYFRRRYTVPLGTATNEIKRYCLDIVTYYGYQRRGSIPEAIDKDYDRAIKWLKECARGEVDLGQEPPPTANSTRTIEVTSTERKFTDTTMQGLL